MDIIIIKTKDRKEIALRDNQWKHIKHRHPEMSNRLNDIEDTIMRPTAVVRNSVIKFYRFIKNEKKYIMVAVRILNGRGFIITAYLTNKIQRG